MNNKTLDLVFAIVKPVLALAGLLAIVFSFITIKGQILVDLGTLSLFKLISSLESLEGMFLKEDDLSQIKMLAYIAVGVVFVFTLITGIFSFLKGKIKSIVPIISSALSIAFSSFVIWFIPQATTDDWLHISLFHAGPGYYVSIATCAVVVILCVVELVLGGSREQDYSYENGYNGYDVNTYDANAYGNMPYTPPQEDKPTTAFNRSEVGQLRALKGEYEGYSFPIENGEILLIGRDPSHCQIVLTQSAQYVSGIHCSVKYENNVYYVCDYSKNGVLINKNKIPQQQWICFPKNSIISLANEQILFELC